MVSILNIVKKIIIAVVIFIVIMIISFASIIGYLTLTAHENSMSDYSYELILSTSGPVDNATLLIPVPSLYNPDSGNNETIISVSDITYNNFDRNNISVKIESRNNFPVLNISADRINPVYKNHIKPIMILPEQNISELQQPTHIYSNSYSEETPVLIQMEIHTYLKTDGDEINTKTPIGNEPLIMPYHIMEDFNTKTSTIYEDYYLSEGTSGYALEVPVFLSYDSDDDNILTISSELQGSNQWHILGWQWNSYTQRIKNEFAGACNGIYQLKGILITGDGSY